MDVAKTVLGRDVGTLGQFARVSASEVLALAPAMQEEGVCKAIGLDTLWVRTNQILNGVGPSTPEYVYFPRGSTHGRGRAGSRGVDQEGVEGRGISDCEGGPSPSVPCAHACAARISAPTKQHDDAVELGATPQRAGDESEARTRRYANRLS